jgi:hypothetical protein
MVGPTLNPDDYERPFWEPIGQFVIRFGYLERSVDHAIASLLKIHERQGEALASQIASLRSRIRLIEKLSYLLTSDEAQREAATGIVDEVIELNSYRNSLVHGPWGSFHVSAREELYWSKLTTNPQNFKTREFQVKLSELKANTNRVTQADARLGNFIQQLLAR